MKAIKTIIFLASFASAQYGQSWMQMTKIGSQTIDFNFAKCYYQSMFGGNFQVEIIVQGSVFNCPYSIQYNPVTGQWK